MLPPRYEYVKCTCSYMFINIYRNPKNTKLVPVRNFYSPFWVYRFFDMRRERHTHSFFLCWLFHLNPTTCGTPPQTNNWSGLSELRKSTFFVQAQISTTTFFSNPQNLQRFWAWHHSRPRSHFLYVFFYCDIADCQIRPACAWTPALN